MRIFLFFILILVGSTIGAQTMLDSVNVLNDKAFELVDSDPKKAEETVNQAVSLSLEHQLKSPLINSHTIKGILYKNKGFYELAASEYVEALKLADELDDKARQSVCLNNIGIIYQQQKNYQKSIQYFLDAIDLEEGLDSPLQLSIRYYNLGKTYDELDSLKLAKAYYLNSLLIEETMHSNEGIMYAYIGLGNVALKNNKLEDAQEYLNDAEKIAASERINAAVPLINLRLGDLFLQQEDWGTAVAYYQSGIFFGEQVDNSTHRLELLYHLATAFEMAENYAEAYKVLSQYFSEFEKSNSLMVNSRIEELQFQYEKAKSEKTIEQLKHENELNSLTSIYSDRTIKYLMVIVGVILLLIGYNLYKVLKNKNG